MTTPTLHDIEVLARTLWGEARSEGDHGMEAVACVVLNRMHDDRWPSSPSGVCLQPSQFSCWLPSDPNRPKMERVDFSDREFRRAYAIAAMAVLAPDRLQQMNARIGYANHYVAEWMFHRQRPSWIPDDVHVIAIGRHVFMRL